MRIDWADDRFVDESHRGAFRSGALDVGQPSGDHDGKVVAVGDQVAWIDEGLAELVYWIWRASVQTDESCQDLGDDGEVALIGFPDANDLRTFLRLAVPYDEVPGGLYDRASGCNLEPEAEGGWEYSCFPKHLRFYDPDEGVGYMLPMAVIFPTTDIPALVSNLCRRETW